MHQEVQLHEMAESENTQCIAVDQPPTKATWLLSVSSGGMFQTSIAYLEQFALAVHFSDCKCWQHGESM